MCVYNKGKTWSTFDWERGIFKNYFPEELKYWSCNLKYERKLPRQWENALQAKKQNTHTHTKYNIVKFYIIMFNKSKKPIVSKDRKQVV